MSQLGIPVISPACVDDTDSWMQQFMAGVAQDGYRVDAVAIHWYGGDDHSGFLGYVDYIHSLYNKPVWLTEFAPADWSGNHGISPQQVYSQVIPQLDQRSYVQRICLFPTVTTDPYIGMSALFNTDWSLTPVGQLYASYWSSGDIRYPGVPGSFSYNPANGVWTVSGGGSNIWNNYDQFQIAALPIPGDGGITGQVTSMQATDPWAKAGVMYRNSDDPSDLFADMMVTPGNGVTFQWRATYGAVPSSVNVTGLSAPVWVKLSCAGNTFSAFYSTEDVSLDPARHCRDGCHEFHRPSWPGRYRPQQRPAQHQHLPQCVGPSERLDGKRHRLSGPARLRGLQPGQRDLDHRRQRQRRLEYRRRVPFRLPEPRRRWQHHCPGYGGAEHRSLGQGGGDVPQQR
jgi:hypothetical protein